MPTKIVLKMLRSHVALLAWMLGVLCLVSLSSGFSHGASTTACVDMKPKHISAHPQNPHSNFISVHTDKSTYLPGDKIPVTIRSTRDFMGFLMQARRVADDQVAGTFILISSGSKLLKCSKDGDTVTHSDKSLKRNLSFIWKAPDQLMGNIKLFVSAVQSYFVYWARVESGPISEQKQNDSILTQSEELKETLPASVYNSTTGRTIPFTEVSTLPSWKLADDINPQAIPQVKWEYSQTPLFTTEGYLRPEVVHVESYLPELFGYPQGHSPATQQSSLDLNQNAAHLQPSLNSMNRETLTDIQTTESSFLLETREFGNTQSEDILNSDFYQAFQPCMNCSDIVQVTSTMVDSGSSAVISLSTKTGQEYSTFWFVDFTSSEVMGWAPTDVQDTKNPVGKIILSSGRVPKREDINPTLTENQLTSHGASANFLQLAETSASRADLGKVVRNMSLGVTQAIEKENDSGRGGSPAKGTDLGIPQLGILLGCSAALGMALAVGLRHLLSQHCRKHTEVSFRDPDSSIISVGESGELVHVRKIRENSFVLVQAEYNVIAPSATPGK
ncbi:reelin domain-containing protein 1-like [Scyliorhinus canicula]|uniref:reelin domain-containing protein 1-like n=1 Tax=Scyliorhinus canicula TaxID=7830 RepID=UPI0018F6EDBE|nr:reelin domain-containing protein 1-like [Scyliorhinus canicula]